VTPNETVENLERAIGPLLANQNAITSKGIRALIEQMRGIPMFAVSAEEAEALARRLEAVHQVTMESAAVLEKPGFKPWLEKALAEGLDPYYWSRYRKLLEEKHFSSQVLSTINTDTDRVLGLLENPMKPGPWNRRGMVVGHVQSGKTANYTGLICKAADAGYRLIVVIAGVHNNLRNQTQKRIDEGFVGRDSARLLSQRESRFIGVGKYDKNRRPVTFTNSLKDFSKSMATGVGIPLQTLNEPAVFVIKKNYNTLKHLTEWLSEHNASRGDKKIDTPMLLIDDEADNASINVSYGKDEVSRINGQIRDLLELFSRSCYVGYTATPFANIFIDPDTDDQMRGQDLFPRHFIVSLDPPTNYFGPDRVFRDDSEALVRHIKDNEDLLPLKHRIDHIVRALPDSLVTAVRMFIVARAIRIARGHGTKHCSMLVNASRFTGVQGQLRAAIQRALEDMQTSVRLHAALNQDRALRDPEMHALHEVWRQEYVEAEPDWSEVQKRLVEAAAPIKVVEVNSRSSGNLNYDDYEDTGLSVIAVGGFSLSRGLTLEGLMISYFLRNSMMYDTLMQMGRWFGYRPDYDDLCRVWMPEDAEGWYAHIAESIELLRDEFRRMAAVGGTPEEFGLKVRTHPETLMVTARNKMGSGEKVIVKIGLDNAFIETTTLRNDPDSLVRHRQAAERLGRDLAAAGKPLDASRKLGGSGSYFLQDVPVAAIRRFLTSFSNHPLSFVTEPQPVDRYIAARESAELRTWDVLVVGVTRTDKDALVDQRMGVPVICQSRTVGRGLSDTTLRPSSRHRVASRGIEQIGLLPAHAAEAERAYREREKKKGTEVINYPDRIYRPYRERPMLMLHPLQVFAKAKDETPIHTEAVFAWGIVFPPSGQSEERVEYVVTTQWLRENFMVEVDEEETEEAGV
jgi:Z1 domain